MTQKIRVLVVDDSKLIRDVLTAILNEQPDIEVVGTAADAFQARDLIKELNPDVLTLDVEMPKMIISWYCRDLVKSINHREY